jgi:hypothetical protein
MGYEIAAGSIMTFSFRNGYKVECNIGPFSENHNRDNKKIKEALLYSPASDSQVASNTCQIKVYNKGIDVTNDMIERGILKKDGFIPSEIFIKVANIIRNLSAIDFKILNFFRIHWKDGKIEDLYGNNIQEAFIKGGYGNGAVRAMDYYEELIPMDQAIKLFTLYSEKFIAIYDYEKFVPYGSRIQYFDKENQKITFVDGHKEYLNLDNNKLTPIEQLHVKIEKMNYSELLSNYTGIKEVNKKDQSLREYNPLLDYYDKHNNLLFKGNEILFKDYAQLVLNEVKDRGIL